MVLIFFWLLSQIKSTLFWLYLWQLKEYRLDRFFAHFDTYKGKKIFLNPIYVTKLFLLTAFFFLPKVTYFVFLLYFSEAVRTIYNSFRKKLLLPIFTKKMIILTVLNLTFIFLFLFLIYHYTVKSTIPFFLLTFDFFSPVIIFFSVFIFQIPIRIFKEWTGERAKRKIKKMEKLIVVGITGSYGKTSTKNFLAKILGFKFKVLKTKKNQNNEFSVANCILKELRSDHQFFICEMGAYKKGEVEKIAKIIKPKIAILTGLNQQHLALFGNMENLISAEGGKELVKFLPADGILIINGENEYLKNEYKNLKIKKKIVALNNSQADFWAEKILIEREKISFFVKEKNGNSVKLELNLIGGQNIINLLLAISAAKIIGKMSLEEIMLACKNIKQEDTGVKLIKTSRGLTIIDSSYSTNPDAVLAHLDYLKTWKNKKIIIMPCLIELGEAAPAIHYAIGKKIKEICDLAILTTYDYFSYVQEAAGEKVIFLENPTAIFKKITTFCEKEDVILLEGRQNNELIKLLKSI